MQFKSIFCCGEKEKLQLTRLNFLLFPYAYVQFTCTLIPCVLSCYLSSTCSIFALLHGNLDSKRFHLLPVNGDVFCTTGLQRGRKTVLGKHIILKITTKDIFKQITIHYTKCIQLQGKNTDKPSPKQ